MKKRLINIFCTAIATDFVDSTLLSSYKVLPRKAKITTLPRAVEVSDYFYFKGVIVFYYMIGTYDVYVYAYSHMRI